MYHNTKTPLDLFWLRVASYSNTDYPFLHPIYSPNSRIPCADLTPFIVEQLSAGNIKPIQKLMKAVISANPGLGVGAAWIEESVDEISIIDFSEYCTSSNQEFFLELKALFILAAKEGGGREFWLVDEKSLLFAMALCCHNVQWLIKLEQLQEKANNFILKMRKDTPFWESYPLLQTLSSVQNTTAKSELNYLLKKLPLMSRIHLLYIANKKTASLIQTTTYKMRSLGLNPQESALSLLSTGICELADDVEAASEVLTKNDITSALDQNNVVYRKSWDKLKLLETLSKNAPNFISEVAAREKTIRIKPEYVTELRALSEYAYALQENIKILFFAGL